MSDKQLKAFLEKVKSDTSPYEKVKGAADAYAALAIAQEAVFANTAKIYSINAIWTSETIIRKTGRCLVTSYLQRWILIFMI